MSFVCEIKNTRNMCFCVGAANLGAMRGIQQVFHNTLSGEKNETIKNKWLNDILVQ